MLRASLPRVMSDDIRCPYAQDVPRWSLAVTLLAAAGGLPLLAIALGWDWYVDGPALVLLAVAGGYAAGAWLPRGPAAAGVLGAVAALVTANQLRGADYHWLDDLVFFVVVVGGPAAAGTAVAARAKHVHRLGRLEAELDEQQRVAVAAARLEEQSRIQQNVHSRLAERIGGIALRAEGAHRSGDLDALDDLETEARGVLDQLRAALGTLGTLEPEPPEPAPVHASGRHAAPSLSALDVALGIGLGLALAVETTVVSAAKGPAWANILAALLVCVPLVVRRRHPAQAVVLSMAAAVAMSAWLTPISATVTGVALLTVVFYTVGAWCRGRTWVPLWLVALTGMVAMEVVSGLTDDADAGDPDWIVLVWAVGAVAVGRVTNGWQERLRRTEETVDSLRRGRDAAVRLATAQEQLELAGELHDTVAHAMTVVCLQAGAHRRPGGDPAAALRTIATIASSSLAELRDGLDSLEAHDEPLEPSRIIALGRRLGVAVDVEGHADVAGGPATLLAFRVVREAIVNVARHAPGASARVVIGVADGALTVEVVDNGSGMGSLVEGTGMGLTGLARSVAAGGGTLVWGPGSAGGFQVAARIPTTKPTPAGISATPSLSAVRR